MTLIEFGLLTLIWTQRFSPVNEEPFNYLVIRYTFYSLTPICIFILI